MFYQRLIRGGAVAAFSLLSLAACNKEGSHSGATTNTSNSSGAKVLKFSAIPDQNKKELKEKFDALAAHLSKELGITLEYVPSADYPSSLNAFKNGDIHLAWFGGLTGVQSWKAVPGARAIAQGDTDPNFFSYFIAHASTGLEKSDDFPAQIADLKFTFGEPKSTSGRLMPQYFIEQITGKPFKEFFKSEPLFTTGHDQTCENVANGTAQVGVVNYQVYEKRIKEGKTDPNVVKVIWKTPPYPDYNWTAHPDLDKIYGAGFTDKLQQALINIKDKALLSAFPRDAMIPAKNDDFDTIKKVAEALGFL